MYVFMYVGTHLRMYECIMYVGTYLLMYVYIYECGAYPRMYVCMYVYRKSLHYSYNINL